VRYANSEQRIGRTFTRYCQIKDQRYRQEVRENNLDCGLWNVSHELERANEK